MNNVEMNNNSNPVQLKEKKKMNKLVHVIILILGVLVCYFVGYFVGMNLNKQEKDTNNDVEVKDEQEGIQEEDDEVIDGDDFVDDEEFVEEEEIEEDDYEEPKWASKIGVNFVSSRNKEEQKVIEIALELYDYGSSALWCEKFNYGKSTSNGYEVKNFQDVNSMFTKDNLVDSLHGDDDFESFEKQMEISKKNGKYYMSHQCDRGGDTYHLGSIFELVSFDDKEIKMLMTSIYYDDELDDENFVTVEKYDFIVQKEDGKWKIAKMTLPA